MFNSVRKLEEKNQILQAELAFAKGQLAHADFKLHEYKMAKHAKCPNCTIGYLMFTDGQKESNPPVFEFQCWHCGQTADLTVNRLPIEVFVQPEEGDKLPWQKHEEKAKENPDEEHHPIG